MLQGAHWIRAAVHAAVLCCLFGSNAVAQYAGPTEPVSDDRLFSVDSPIGSIDYVPARGLRLGRTGLTVGGFTTLEIDKVRDESGTLELDGVNLLALWEPLDFARAFAEIEIGDLFAYEMRTSETFSDPDVTIERLHGDLSYRDSLNLRVGKYQTPFGIWNLVPAEPFTWTATEPVQVETAFDEHQTGAALYGSFYPGSHTLDYWVYGQFVDPLDPSEDPPPSDRSIGGRLRFGESLGRWALGSSFLASERRGRWSYLGGFDAHWQRGPFELQGELILSRGDRPERDLWGVYAQGVYHLGEHVRLLRALHLVGRYEHFAPREGRRANVFNVGLTWIPYRFLILKAGYQFTQGRPEDVDPGLFTSFSILF